MQIRPASEDRDLALIQSLYHEAYPPPVPHASHLVNNHHVRIAETDDGIVIGFRVLSASNFVWVAVLAEYRRRGVGTLLLHDALEQASELGFTELTSRVLAHNSAGNAFCERFKFKPFVHAVNLALDLADWDASALTPMLDKAGEGGIQFLTFADMGDNSANRHRLYTLNKTLSATIPRDQPQEFISFETYVERRIASKTMPHDGIFMKEAREHRQSCTGGWKRILTLVNRTNEWYDEGVGRGAETPTNPPDKQGQEHED